MAEQVMSAPAALARVWACLACGSDHVVAESARLLVRLMAPAPARHGAPPWRLLRGALFAAIAFGALAGCVFVIIACQLCARCTSLEAAER
jgi:hypothetical protein